MFALIFANRLELWWYRDPAACASYTALSIWSSASRNLFDGDARFGGGGEAVARLDTATERREKRRKEGVALYECHEIHLCQFIYATNLVK